jgi:hypothetical protein
MRGGSKQATMKQLVMLTTLLAASTAMAQQSPVNSALLDHLAGNWLMQGTVGKQPVTHDFNAEWVLQHHYLRFREVSRDKTDKGEPQYEATVFIGWNDKDQAIRVHVDGCVRRNNTRVHRGRNAQRE